MKRLLTLLMLIPILTITMISCETDKKPAEEKETALPDKNDPANVFSGDQLMYTFRSLPVISMNQPEVQIPDDALGVFDSIALFLQNNPDYNVQITGLYAMDEDSLEGFENLGAARASQFADLLKGLGVAPERIMLSGEMKELAFGENGTLPGGYLISFVNMQTAAKAKNPFDRTIYFFAAEDIFRWDPELKDYMPNVGKYLADNPGVNMILTGHTDYNGNHLLGEMRAEEVKEYFMLYGLPEARMIIRSEGPDKPVAPNDTQENKALNRRVEITFE